MENDSKILARYTLGSGRKSQSRVILALERALRLVKPGGLVGIVVIDGILNTASRVYVRDYIKQHAWIKAVVSLAPATFEGYGARAKTSILILRKKDVPDEGVQEPIFMAVADNTGYAPNGSPIPGNELPDILIDYKAFLSGRVLPGHHLNAWIATVDDRLDAEFYRPRAYGSTGPDLSVIRQDVTTLLAQIRQEYEALGTALDQAVAAQELKTIPLGEVLQEVTVREALVPQQRYRLLGVRWWGQGTFIREEKIGREIKVKTLYRVQSGWLIYNRLFAFRGSFAIVEPEHDGCYVSGEFPTFDVRPGIDDADIVKHYIVYCLNSPQYLMLVDALSTGSTKTSRNRFNQNQFLKIPLQLPRVPEGIQRLVELLEKAHQMQMRQRQLQIEIDRLKEAIAWMLPTPTF